MKTVQAILLFGGLILFSTIAIQGTAHACGGDKEMKTSKNESTPKRETQSEAPKTASVKQDEVYGPPAPTAAELGAAVTLSQSGSR